MAERLCLSGEVIQMIRGCASNGGIAANEEEAATGKPEAYRYVLRQSRIKVGGGRLRIESLDQ